MSVKTSPLRKLAAVILPAAGSSLLMAAGLMAAGLWSLQPVRRTEPPSVPGAAHPIDRFILHRLAQSGIAPSPEAPRHIQLRRLSLDLTGLPPAPSEMTAFLADTSPGAWPKQVDRLLRSPHFGEKWARHWLDQARYADSDGFRADRFRPHAWRYRQWVIDAINRDLPFDQFTLEQLAGDLLPNATQDQLIATGFHRNTLTNREGGTDPEQFRVEQVVDRASTTGTVWLGLTAGCAQCHDHKFDPISQRDFYRLFAFFNDADEEWIEAPVPGELGPHLQARPLYDQKRHELFDRYGVPALQAEWERGMFEAAANPGRRLDWDHAFDDLRTDCEDGEKILRTPAPERTRRQAKILTDYFIGQYHRVITKERSQELKFDELSKQLRELDGTLPVLGAAPIIRARHRTSHILARGDFKQPGQPVEPGTPSALHLFDPAGKRANRLDLARWIASPANPLTARVIVNRIWQEYFGTGLVRTSDNFGAQGEAPSHPELLDWLAAEFMDSGWSVKHIHRLIVTSAVYRQSSNVRPGLADKDPENRLLARQSRLRLHAEAIRDSALFASGLLALDVGGPSVRPPQPAGAGHRDWKQSPGRDRYRRALYIQLSRTAPYPFLANFDAPAGYGAACRRNRSNTPLQALNLLNDPVFVESARALALRVTDQGGNFDVQLDRMFVLCLGRTPDSQERQWFTQFHQRQQGDGGWTALASILLNLDEFITRE